MTRVLAGGCAVLLLACAPAGAQAVLTTTFASNNACQGNMFDLVAGCNGVTIDSFDVNIVGSSVTMEVWAVTGGGSYVGHEMDPSPWTLLASPTVTSNGPDVATPLNLSLGHLVPAGGTQGFYVTGQSGFPISYTNGTGVVGTFFTGDGFLQFYEGSGFCSHFGPPLETRVFNGNIHYTPAPGTCPPNPWQINQAGASLAVDGLPDPGWNAPLVAQPSFGQTTDLVVGGTPAGMPWDLGFTVPEPGVALGSGGIGTAGGQTINLDLAAPSLFFLFELDFTNSFAPTTIGLLNPPTGSAQLAVMDPASADGFSLSHLNELTVPPSEVMIEAVGSNSFNQTTTSGFWRIDHVSGPPVTALQLSFATTTVPGQSSIVFDTDQTGMADVFHGGNSTQSGCQGTYRNGSEVTVGLVFAGTPASPCDPMANQGWVGSDPSGPANSYKTVDFAFTSFAHATFELDLDTDGGLGVSGDAMEGCVVTVALPGGVSLTGALAPDPLAPNRSFVVLTSP